jgi:MFS family permease
VSCLARVRTLSQNADSMPGLVRNFWIYWAAGLLLSLGLMTFFLVYNLYLLDLGFQEGLIGRVTASMTLGSLAATLASSFLLDRLGLNRAIQACAVLMALSLGCRASAEHPSILLLLAFLNGIALGIWMVAAPPFLAQNTSRATRSLAFSLNYGGSIATGALAGIFVREFATWMPYLVKAQLSGRLLHQWLLYTSAALVLPASLLLFLLKTAARDSAAVSPAGSSLRIPSRTLGFLFRLLPVIMFWSFFTGGFTPFFNVFFHQKFQQSLEAIGSIFSFSQVCQTLAVLTMPLAVRKLGRFGALFFTQLAASLALLTLVFANQVHYAGAIYLTYLSFQAMCEPALEQFIMDSVPVGARNFMSSWRYAILFTVHAFASVVAGTVIERHGYVPLLFILAASGASAALSFYFFFRSTPSLADLTNRASRTV